MLYNFIILAFLPSFEFLFLCLLHGALSLPPLSLMTGDAVTGIADLKLTSILGRLIHGDTFQSALSTCITKHTDINVNIKAPENTRGLLSLLSAVVVTNPDNEIRVNYAETHALTRALYVKIWSRFLN